MPARQVRLDREYRDAGIPVIDRHAGTISCLAGSGKYSSDRNEDAWRERRGLKTLGSPEEGCQTKRQVMPVTQTGLECI